MWHTTRKALDGAGCSVLLHQVLDLEVRLALFALLATIMLVIIMHECIFIRAMNNNSDTFLRAKQYSLCFIIYF